MDQIVKAISSTEDYIIVACTSTKLLQDIVKNHKIVTGFNNKISDVISANILMSMNLKSEKEQIGLSLNTNGMLSQINSNGNYYGGFNGYGVLNKKGASIIGDGVLEVHRYYNGKEVSSSQITADKNDISKIIVDYYFKSEQVYSVLLLASISDKKSDEFYGSGGILIQLLPNAKEEVKDIIAESVAKIESLSKKIALGLSGEDMIKLIDEGAKIIEERPVFFECNCSNKSVLDSLKLINKNDIDEIINEDGGVKIICNACNKEYIFYREDFDYEN
ncbi:MAG: Hsp33 family molecular chaperone HslO [Bacilli bacterium]